MSDVDENNHEPCSQEELVFLFKKAMTNLEWQAAFLNAPQNVAAKENPPIKMSDELSQRIKGFLPRAFTEMFPFAPKLKGMPEVYNEVFECNAQMLCMAATYVVWHGRYENWNPQPWEAPDAATTPILLKTALARIKTLEASNAATAPTSQRGDGVTS